MKYMPNKITYTVEEVSEILGIKRRTVNDYIKKGKIKALKIGREFRIPREYLEEYMDTINYKIKK
jgi:excisionase family DNA binding protein